MKGITSVVVVGLITGTFVASYGDSPFTPSHLVGARTLPEPTMEPPTTPKVGDEQPPRDPFTPYSIGPTKGWSYDDLTPAEQAVVDRGIATNSEAVHAAFDAATIQQAQVAATEAAAISLGVSDLWSIGVVP